MCCLTRLGDITDYAYPSGRNTYGVADAGPHAVVTADGVDYSYDDVGNLVEADDNGTVTAYTYDPRNQLSTIDLPGTTDDLAMVWGLMHG